MRPIRTRDSGRAAMALLAAMSAFAIAGCSSTGGGPKMPTSATARSTSQTAPADLQLLCASTAAEQLGVAGGNTLPVSSMRSGGNAYQVNLTFEGGQAVCFIGEDGIVRSINRV